MGTVTVLALRVVIAIALVGSLVVQGVLAPLIWLDMDDARADVRTSFVVIVVLGVVTMQVTAVCIWRLLTMVRRGTVFSHAAFRYVDIVIGAITAASVLTFGIAVVAAYSNRTTPGDEVAPVALDEGGITLRGQVGNGEAHGVVQAKANDMPRPFQVRNFDIQLARRGTDAFSDRRGRIDDRAVPVEDDKPVAHGSALDTKRFMSGGKGDSSLTGSTVTGWRNASLPAWS